jgi:hypothetical protein
MKKITAALLLACFTVSIAFAQQDEKKTTVKKTSNVKEKVHNTFSKHKHYNGYKVKTVKKDANGHEIKTKTKVKD